MTDNYVERSVNELPEEQLFPNSARQQKLYGLIVKAIKEQDELTDEELALVIWRLTRRAVL